jgi:DNA repair protein RAD7
VGSLKSPASAPPRRSLRLAGVSSPATPVSEPSARDGSSSGSGSGSGRGDNRRGRGRGRSRLSFAPAASPTAGSSRSYGGESQARGSAGGADPGSVGTFITLWSGSCIAKRPVETGDQTGAGSSGEGKNAGQMHDEMLQREDGSPVKRFKRVFVGGVETDYVADSESDSDDDCVVLGEVCTKLRLSIGPSVVKGKTIPVNMDWTEEGIRNDPASTSKEKSVDGGMMPSCDLVLGKAYGVETQQLSPVGCPSSPEKEIYSDMYFKEEQRRYELRNQDKGKGKLVLGNNGSGADVSVGIQDGTSTERYTPDSKGKGKMVGEDSWGTLSSSSSSEDDMEYQPVGSKEVQSSSVPASDSMEPLRRLAARERAIRLAPKFAFVKADKDEQSEDDDEEEEELEPAAAHDWPGPFSTAAGIYEEREAKLRARAAISSNLKKSADKAILWLPSKDRKVPLRSAPSLTNLCLNTLADHADGIESLGGIPDDLKHRLLKLLCHSRKMNTHLLNELLCENPTELQLFECSWLSEDDFENCFGKCRTENLQVLFFLRFMQFHCYDSCIYTCYYAFILFG